MFQYTRSIEASPRVIAKYGEFRYRILQPHETALLQRIHQLVAANLVTAGDVSVERAMSAAADERFDHHLGTTIVVIEDASGRLAGTYSFTKVIDNDAPIYRHFRRSEMSNDNHRSWLNGWRFSMSPLFQGPQLRLQTLKVVWLVCLLEQVDDFVLYFNERLLAYYQRLLIGEEMARTMMSFDGQTRLPVIAMRCPVLANAEKHALTLKEGGANELAMVS